MNWYKIAQFSLLDPEQAIQKPGAYFEIGHKSFFGQEETDCQEWLWVWDRNLDIRPTGDMDISHENLWGKKELGMYKGRVSECDHRISIAFPVGEMNMEPPDKLIDDLYKIFPGYHIYLFHRNRGSNG